MSKITTGLFTSTTDKWGTPQKLFDELNDEFHFTLDVCANSDNAKCRNFFTEEQDGLKQDWQGVCYCNPPYGSEIIKWVKKAYDTARGGVWNRCLPTSGTHRYALVA